MQKLEEITIKEAGAKSLLIKDDLKVLDDREPILSISGTITSNHQNNDELLGLEIALRKCERVGVFEKNT